MLLPSGNPFKCHEEVLFMQPIIPPKRFDVFRQYYPRKLLGPLKSGERGLRPPRSVASVERTPAARPLLSIGRASGSTSGSALELVYAGGEGAAEIFIPLPRDFGSYDLFAYLPRTDWACALLCFPHSPIFPSQLPPCRLIETLSGVASLQVKYGSIIRASY